MAKMGTVWDRTTDVIGGRTAMLATIAGLALFLPSLILDFLTPLFVAALIAPATYAMLIVAAILSIAAVVATLWGQLAIVAVASDPATTRRDAFARASARLLPAIGVMLVLMIAAAVLVMPIVVVIATSDYNFFDALNSSAPPKLPPGIALFLTLYPLLLLGLFVLAVARLLLVNAVVLNERLGLGAIRRSIALTRGHTWKLIGLLILFGIVILVAVGAAQLIAGLVFRLVLGSDAIATATFLGAVAARIVTTIFTVIAGVFTAQLYLALREAIPVPE